MLTGKEKDSLADKFKAMLEDSIKSTPDGTKLVLRQTHPEIGDCVWQSPGSLGFEKLTQWTRTYLLRQIGSILATVTTGQTNLLPPDDIKLLREVSWMLNRESGHTGLLTTKAQEIAAVLTLRIQKHDEQEKKEAIRSQDERSQAVNEAVTYLSKPAFPDKTEKKDTRLQDQLNLSFLFERAVRNALKVRFVHARDEGGAEGLDVINYHGDQRIWTLSVPEVSGHAVNQIHEAILSTVKDCCFVALDEWYKEKGKPDIPIVGRTETANVYATDENAFRKAKRQVLDAVKESTCGDAVSAKGVDAGPFQTHAIKPPLGLRPEIEYLRRATEGRCKEILEAMERYAAANKPIPMGWIKELASRQRSLGV